MNGERGFGGSLWLAAAAAALLLGGCGERPQVVHYEQGKYQGKPDAPAYQSPPYDGDKQAWDKAMRTRAQNQNEYSRIQ